VIDAADFAAHLQRHVELAGSALAIATLLGLAFGSLSSHAHAARGPIVTLAGIGRVIPSLALITLMIPVFGLGFRSACVALTLLAIPPILINTDLGFRSVDPAASDAARGMGMTATQMFWRIEWPAALPITFAGVQTAAIEVIASATLAAFIGAGGLGEYITRGLDANITSILFIGAVGVAALALLTNLALGTLRRLIGVRT